jgi:hypothetical protein
MEQWNSQAARVSRRVVAGAETVGLQGRSPEVAWVPASSKVWWLAITQPYSVIPIHGERAICPMC